MKNKARKTHSEHAAKTPKSRPCSYYDLNFGGECFNCGFVPAKTCGTCVYFDDRDLPKWKTGNCLFDNSEMKPNHRGPNSVCGNWRGK